MAADQRIAGVEWLGQTNEGGIDDAFAVRVVFTAGVAANTGALHFFRAGVEVEVVHGDKDAALRGLETVAGVGESAGNDDAHGIGEITVAQIVVDVQVANAQPSVFVGDFGLGIFGVRRVGRIGHQVIRSWEF